MLSWNVGQMMKQHGTRVVKRWASFVWRRSQIYYILPHGQLVMDELAMRIILLKYYVLPKLLIFLLEISNLAAEKSEYWCSSFSCLPILEVDREVTTLWLTAADAWSKVLNPTVWRYAWYDNPLIWLQLNTILSLCVDNNGLQLHRRHWHGLHGAKFAEELTWRPPASACSPAANSSCSACPFLAPCYGSCWALAFLLTFRCRCHGRLIEHYNYKCNDEPPLFFFLNCKVISNATYIASLYRGIW
jgi:hypothetical protein